MKTPLIIFMLFLTAFSLKGQKSILPGDSLKDRAVFTLPQVSIEELSKIKSEFEKHPQILKAVFVYHNHNALLVEMDPARTLFFQYYDLLKIIEHYYKKGDHGIKTPEAYNFIFKSGFDDTSVTIKD